MVKKEHSVFLISAAVLIIDQATKFIAKGKDIQIVNNLLYIKHTSNTGAAFGVLKGFNISLIFLSVFILGLALYYFEKIPDKKYVIFSFGLFIGGLLGNLIDRIALGHVTDFIYFTFWPAFNLADSAICIGVLGLIIWIWKQD